MHLVQVLYAPAFSEGHRAAAVTTNRMACFTDYRLYSLEGRERDEKRGVQLFFQLLPTSRLVCVSLFRVFGLSIQSTSDTIWTDGCCQWLALVSWTEGERERQTKNEHETRTTRAVFYQTYRWLRKDLKSEAKRA